MQQGDGPHSLCRRVSSSRGTGPKAPRPALGPVLRRKSLMRPAPVAPVYRTRFFGQTVGLCGAPERLVMPSGASVVRALVAVLLDQPFGVIPGKPVDSVDGLRPPSLTTGAAATSVPSISRPMAFITPVSSLTNSCPEKPGAAHPVAPGAQAGRLGGSAGAARAAGLFPTIGGPLASDRRPIIWPAIAMRRTRSMQY